MREYTFLGERYPFKCERVSLFMQLWRRKINQTDTALTFYELISEVLMPDILPHHMQTQIHDRAGRLLLV